MLIPKTQLDEILAIQLTVARLGEKELMNWWNIDAADERGGGDFLKRLVGPEMSPLAAGEILLSVCEEKEEAQFKKAPDRDSVKSLFLLSSALYFELKARYRHFKKYPADTPEEIKDILSHDKDFKTAGLFSKLSNGKSAKTQGTAIGKELSKPEFSSPVELVKALTSVLTESDKGKYPFPYARIQDE